MTNCRYENSVSLVEKTRRRREIALQPVATMVKTAYKRLKGSQNLRQRLLLSTLSSTAILIEDIRVDSAWPGLLPHEVSLLRLLETVTDDCVVEINETGE